MSDTIGPSGERVPLASEQRLAGETVNTKDVVAAPSDIEIYFAESVRGRPHRVTVHNIDMPFGGMVVFMVKWALAAIPAMIIVAVVYFLLVGMFFSVRH